MCYERYSIDYKIIFDADKFRNIVFIWLNETKAKLCLFIKNLYKGHF